MKYLQNYLLNKRSEQSNYFQVFKRLPTLSVRFRISRLHLLLKDKILQKKVKSPPPKRYDPPPKKGFHVYNTKLHLIMRPIFCRSMNCEVLLHPNLPTPPLGQDMTQGQFLSGVQ